MRFFLQATCRAKMYHSQRSKAIMKYALIITALVSITGCSTINSERATNAYWDVAEVAAVVSLIAR